MKIDAWNAHQPHHVTFWHQDEQLHSHSRENLCKNKRYVKIFQAFQNNEEQAMGTKSKVLTLEQAAAYLLVSPEELQAELEKKTIPGVKIGGKWRISQNTLDRLLGSIESSSIDIPTSTTITQNIDSKPNERSPHYQVSTKPLIAPPPTLQPDEAKPLIELPMTPNLEKTQRVRARVFIYDIYRKHGYARLGDGRTVWLDDKNRTQSDRMLFPGDIVELELQASKRGLTGLKIERIPNEIALADQAHKPTSPTKKPTARANLPQSTASPSILPQQKAPQNSGKSTARAEELYQKAAVARTERRYNDARKLFREAIKAGGGITVYEVFAKMEQEIGNATDAKRILDDAISRFPDHPNFYTMYGHMLRRGRRYQEAEVIFRRGLTRLSSNIQLKTGLAQTLVQIGTETSLQEAGEIFEWLKQRNKLNKNDNIYRRFNALQKNVNANRAFDFFQSVGMKVDIAGKRDLPWYVTDLVAETSIQELSDSFGISGAILVRCFRKITHIDIINTQKFLKSLGNQGVLGLQSGREVMLNPSIAFVAVPDSSAIRDQIMSILSEANEAIVPLDESNFRDKAEPLKTLHDLLGQYLGQRDLYDSTGPVSGRRFYGRDQLLHQLADEVNRGQFIGIYGLRKMGKTSLLHQLRDQKLRGEIIAYVDLQASVIHDTGSCADLYWELERDLYQRLRTTHPEIAHELRLGKLNLHEEFNRFVQDGESARIVFSEDIKSILEGLLDNRISGCRHLVIILDELEKMLPLGGQQKIEGYLEFFGLLRGLAQTERYRGLISSIVAAANAAISERGFWEGRENPVFALYKPFPLTAFSAPECQHMIVSLGKSMSVYWEEDALNAVIEETGGHPFLSRSLCSKIVKQYPKRPLTVSKNEVLEQIPEYVRDEGAKLEQITELMQRNFPKEADLLEKIALDTLPSSLSDESLRHLLGYQLIEPSENGYRITIHLLKRWLRRSAGVRE